MNRLLAFAAGLVVVMLIASSTLFVVDQRKYAIVFNLGDIKRVIAEPGLYYKLPPPFENVVFLDKRIQTIDNAQADRFITSEKKNLLVDLYVKWRIVDPRRYFVSFKGDASLAGDRLTQIVRAALNEEFTKRTVSDVVSNERDAVMQAVRKKVGKDAADVGVEIVDVRLKRVDLMAEISDSVYRRMEAERKQVANMQRSEGAAEAEAIRANADRQRQVILADAYKQAQILKGEGDAKAAAIYADAFSRDPQFYAFYRSLEAYRRSFSGSRDLIVADPNSEFFRFMRNPSGTGAPASGGTKR